MALPFPSPMLPAASRTDVFLGYLDYFRAVLIGKLDGLPEAELRASRLPSGWSPLELVKHLTHVERRWLEWGFAGRPVPDPWADHRDGRWYVAADESPAALIAALQERGETTRAIVTAHSLDETGAPGERWEGADPPTLERVLFHLVQEYARHVGHIDVVRELVDGQEGESPATWQV